MSCGGCQTAVIRPTEKTAEDARENILNRRYNVCSGKERLAKYVYIDMRNNNVVI